jgi:hypothetical protein
MVIRNGMLGMQQVVVGDIYAGKEGNHWRCAPQFYYTQFFSSPLSNKTDCSQRKI